MIDYLQRWDKWREAIANGDKSSWPRDEFENIVEELTRLREENERLRNTQYDCWHKFRSMINQAKEVYDGYPAELESVEYIEQLLELEIRNGD